MKIGAAAETTDVSADTLRYYEKIGLLGSVPRTAAGIRDYGEPQISRVRFIRRAQAMGFTLEEIGRLLEFRTNPRTARPRVRELAAGKLEEIEKRLVEIRRLRDELRQLLMLCSQSEDGCPILDRME